MDFWSDSETEEDFRAEISDEILIEIEEDRIKPGDLILMASFGAGVTYGASLIKWSNRVIPLTTSDAELPPCEKTGLEIIASHVDRYKKHSLESVS